MQTPAKGKLSFTCPCCQREVTMSIDIFIPAKDTPTPVAAPTQPLEDGDFLCPFGKYNGTPMSQVPYSYWRWMLDQPNPIEHARVREWVEEHSTEILTEDPTWQPKFPARLEPPEELDDTEPPAHSYTDNIPF